MSVCRVRSLSLFGIDALPVEVEVDVGAGLPGFSIVGLPDTAVQEARERVRVAISNSGYKFPTKKVIVNLAPANLRKEGLTYRKFSDCCRSVFRLDDGVNSPVRGVSGVKSWCQTKAFTPLSIVR